MVRIAFRALAVVILLGPLFAFLAVPGRAEEGADALYRITDIAVDIAAPTAAEARDKARTDAERAAFEQLLTRLGASNVSAASFQDKTIAALVRALDIEHETVLAGRYKGLLSVQFKPQAVQEILKDRHVMSATRAGPLTAVLPIVQGEPSVLWEEDTPWRQAWAASPSRAGRTPIVVPTGDLADIARISATEALKGDSGPLQTLAQAYHADEVAVAVLGPDHQHLEVTRYGADGQRRGTTTVETPGAPKATPPDLALRRNVAAIRRWLDAAPPSTTSEATIAPKEGKEGASDTPKAVSFSAEDKEPVVHLLVTVQLPNLAAWPQVRARLTRVVGVERIDLLTLVRGAAQVDLTFVGTLEVLRLACAEQGLGLGQAPGSGAWILWPGR